MNLACWKTFSEKSRILVCKMSSSRYLSYIFKNEIMFLSSNIKISHFVLFFTKALLINIQCKSSQPILCVSICLKKFSNKDKQDSSFFSQQYSDFKFLERKSPKFSKHVFQIYVLKNRKQTLIAPKYALNLSSLMYKSF